MTGGRLPPIVLDTALPGRSRGPAMKRRMVGSRLGISAWLVLLVAGCAVQLIAPYDQRIDDGVSSLQRSNPRIKLFFSLLRRLRISDRHFVVDQFMRRFSRF